MHNPHRQLRTFSLNQQMSGVEGLLVVRARQASAVWIVLRGFDA